MPLIHHSTFQPGYCYTHPHIQTILPSLFRAVDFIYNQRTKINTPDEDFLILDSKLQNSPEACLILHGLESSSDSTYIKGMAKALFENGYDVHCLNFRSCTEEGNNLIRSYHSGETEDVQTTIQWIISKYDYKAISLVGFSLGGNVTLKYLGENRNRPERIHRAIAISVPCDLMASALKLGSWENKIYMKRFINMLVPKVIEKSNRFPGQLDVKQFKKMQTFAEFDEHYTARFHGFQSAVDYWNRSSSKNFIPNIKTRTLLINSANDPFLTPSCFPIKEAKLNPDFYLEIPKNGGHVGFLQKIQQPTYWHENRTLAFLKTTGEFHYPARNSI
jgi:predicted alpha/beta-fold hydrolase